MYAADDRVAFFVDPVALADFITIYPQFIDVLISPATYEASHNYYAALKSLMPFRCLRCFRLLSFARTAKQREMGTLFFGVVAIIICFGAIGQVRKTIKLSMYIPYNVGHRSVSVQVQRTGPEPVHGVGEEHDVGALSRPLDLQCHVLCCHHDCDARVGCACSRNIAGVVFTN